MTQLTREGLSKAIWHKTPLRWEGPVMSATDAADWITRCELAQVLIPGTRPPQTFAAGYAAVYGHKLPAKLGLL